MILNIVNTTSSPITFLSSAITAPANGSVAVTNTTYQLALSTDGTMRSNLVANNIYLTDGTNNFGGIDGLNYLTRINNLLVALADTSGNGITSTTVGSKQPLDNNIHSIGGSALTLGQKTSASSIPIVLASDQSEIPVSQSGTWQLKPELDLATSGTITAVNGAVTLTMSAISNINVSVTGTWVATLVFEGQSGDGVWNMLQANNPAGGLLINTANTNNTYTVGVGGFTQFRVRASAYTSGTVDITMNGSIGSQQNLAVDANGNQQIVGDTSSGTTDSGSNPVKIAGVYNSSSPTFSNGQRAALQTDVNGRLLVNPGSTAPTIGDLASTNTFNAVNTYAQIDTAGYTGFGAALLAGTFIGTIVPEVSYDNGGTWIQTQFYNPSSQQVSDSIVFAAANAYTAWSILVPGGANLARIRVSAYTSGSAFGYVRATVANGVNYTIHTPIDGSRATYSATKLGLAPGNTDIFTITGSATRTIRVLRVEVSFTQSIYGEIDVALIKRSTANTGGTSAAQTAVSFDSNNPAATATVLAYTANPTLGTAVGTVRAIKLFGQATSEPYAGSSIAQWDFGDRPGQAIVLRGTTQVLAVNLNGVSSSGGSFDISIEWTEE